MIFPRCGLKWFTQSGQVQPLPLPNGKRRILAGGVFARAACAKRSEAVLGMRRARRKGGSGKILKRSQMQALRTAIDYEKARLKVVLPDRLHLSWP